MRRRWSWLTPRILVAGVLGAATAGCGLTVLGSPPLVVRVPAELPDEAPAVCLDDLYRFPDRETAWAYYGFGVLHRKWLESQPLWSDTRQDLEAWAADARHCLAAWDALADAWGPPATDLERTRACRLGHLRRLRRVLGPEDYADGVMPAPCPWWRMPVRK